MKNTTNEKNERIQVDVYLKNLPIQEKSLSRMTLSKELLEKQYELEKLLEPYYQFKKFFKNSVLNVQIKSGGM